MVQICRLAWTVLVCVSLLAAASGSARPIDSQRPLAAAYRANPSPQLLLKLSQEARGEERVIEARDLARRALADPTASFSPEEKGLLEELSGLPIVRYGELLVQGPHGAFVSISGRLRGVLPLLMPLLVESSRHEVVLELRSRIWRTQVEIPEGRRVEVRVSGDSDTVTITTPPAVLLLARTQAGEPLPAAALPILDQSLRRVNLARAAVEDTLRRPLGGAGCTRSLKCQLELGARAKVEFVLTVRLDQSAGSLKAAYELVDVGVGDVASQDEVSCSSCSLQVLLASLDKSFSEKLLEGSTRPRGELDVSSTPQGAEVRRGALVLGRTPLRRPAWAGPGTLELRLSGYRDTPLQLNVIDGQTASASVTLEKDSSGILAALRRRPAWRLGVGGAAGAVGVFMLGVGIAALVVDGRCVDEPVAPGIPCERSFATLAPGIGLTIAGPLFLGAGAALLAVPPR